MIADFAKSAMLPLNHRRVNQLYRPRAKMTRLTATPQVAVKRRNVSILISRGIHRPRHFVEIGNQSQ